MGILADWWFQVLVHKAEPSSQGYQLGYQLDLEVFLCILELIRSMVRILGLTKKAVYYEC